MKGISEKLPVIYVRAKRDGKERMTVIERNRKRNEC